MVGHDANIMDIAGPWEVFQNARADFRSLFKLHTVGPTRDELILDGGLRLLPHYAIDEAPPANLVVVPAHHATASSLEWLRQASRSAEITMSVCTGAFHLAAAGLLDGLSATTHHLFFDAFQRAYPDIELRRTDRFVDSGRIATAGGLTAGIDLALHVVDRLFGSEAATSTANYLEYEGHRWQGGQS